MSSNNLDPNRIMKSRYAPVVVGHKLDDAGVFKSVPEDERTYCMITYCVIANAYACCYSCPKREGCANRCLNTPEECGACTFKVVKRNVNGQGAIIGERRRQVK